MNAETTPLEGRIGADLGRPPAWVSHLGLIRIGIIAILGLSTYLAGEYNEQMGRVLFPFYAFGLLASLGYLIVVSRGVMPSRPHLWAQILVDFGVVAAAVSFTGGSVSMYTFLFVLVILEAGVQLGPPQGFLLAALATTAILMQVFLAPGRIATVEPGQLESVSQITLWSNFLVQTLAYFLTASISGYWNQQLRRLQQFQREILDNMNNGFLITDEEGTVLVSNRAASRILELDDDNAVGKPVEEILPDASGAECPVKTALRSGSDFTRYEFQVALKSGNEKLIGLSTSRIMDWRRRENGVIVSFSDLTEMADMREELQRQDRLAVVGELAAGLAHEIRNPVAAIRGAVDELQNNLDEPAIADRLSDIAMRESDQLNRIVTDFLQFSRNPSRRRDVFDLRGLVEEVCDGLGRADAGSGLNIETVMPGDSCLMSGDRVQIKQVFLNLGKNALEAMDGSGTLRVVVERDAVTINVRFEDEGPGIPPDQVMRIFEPFYTTKEKGVGMGLAICMRIVTAHDGTIRAMSRGGGGTAMIVRLPAARTGEIAS